MRLTYWVHTAHTNPISKHMQFKAIGCMHANKRKKNTFFGLPVCKQYTCETFFFLGYCLLFGIRKYFYKISVSLLCSFASV